MRIITYLTLLLLLMACEETPQKEPLVLWYDSPARNWDEALPIGNGRSGAMIFGRTDNEQLQLNENTLYSGEPSVVFKDVKITPEMFDKVVGLMNTLGKACQESRDKQENIQKPPIWSARTGSDACISIINRSATCISKTTNRERLTGINGH